MCVCVCVITFFVCIVHGDETVDSNEILLDIGPRKPDDFEGGVSDALKHGDIVIIKLIEAKNLEKADFWPGIERVWY